MMDGKGSLVPGMWTGVVDEAGKMDFYLWHFLGRI
jgi:hypothetical protein